MSFIKHCSAALALLVAAIAGGVMMASNMKGLTSSGNSASSSSQAGKDGISPEDKAKAQEHPERIG